MEPIAENNTWPFGSKRSLPLYGPYVLLGGSWTLCKLYPVGVVASIYASKNAVGPLYPSAAAPTVHRTRPLGKRHAGASFACKRPGKSGPGDHVFVLGL